MITASVRIATLPHPGDVRDNFAVGGREAIQQAIDQAVDQAVESSAESATLGLPDADSQKGKAYVSVEPGTRVRAGDRGNIGEIAKDNGPACIVRFVSPEGQLATKELPKEQLSLTDGTPLATVPKEDKALCPTPIGELIEQYPRLRKPMIQGLARAGETLGVIGSTKMHKSLTIAGLAICAATGQQWMGFEVTPGKVLMLDNELHQETMASRMRQVAEAMGVSARDYRDRIDVVCLRGQLRDIYELDGLFERLSEDEYPYVFLDALYRATPEGFSENDNAQTAALFNRIDHYAMRLGCVFGVVHHSTKGSQSGKSVTDVGSGAGSQSRAVDTHLVMRPHQEPDCVVLDAVCRSWPPPKPRVLRWEWPTWTVADDLDPASLKPERQRRTEDRQIKIDAKAKEILDTFNHFPDGALKTDIRGRVGQGKIFDAAWLQVCNGGDLLECDIVRPNRQTYPGFRRKYPDNQDE